MPRNGEKDVHIFKRREGGALCAKKHGGDGTKKLSKVHPLCSHLTSSFGVCLD